MRSLPAFVAVGLVVLGTFAAAVISSPFGFLGEARGGENQSTEGLPSPAPPPDPVGGTVIATIAVGSLPVGVAYDSGNGSVYVANYGSKNVTVGSGTGGGAMVPVGDGTVGLACKSKNGRR